MRKVWLAPVLIVVSIVLQLTVVNGLRLPGHGVPDLVLVLVAALAVADGPLAGVIVGFAAGLCLDLAPPGSPMIGQYALVFCLAGWAAGRVGRAADSSPLLTVGSMAVVVAAAEALSTGIGLALEPAEVTPAGIREILPSAIGYDIVLCPLVLYLVVVASSLVTEGLAAGAAAAGLRGVPAWSKGANEPERRPLRTGDGWLSGGHDYHHSRQPTTRTRARLRLAGGVAGSASGLVRHPGSARRAASAGRTPGTPSLRLANGRRGDGTIGSSVGSQRARHPGMLPGASRGFRPRGGQPGGSATGQHGVIRPPAGPGRSSTPIRFGGHRGDGTLGRALGSASRSLPGRRATATPRMRTGTSRSALTTRSRPRVVPKVRFKTAAPAPARRPAAVPRFRRQSSGLRSSGSSYGLVARGVLNQSTFAAARRRGAAPRLRLATGRRRSGPSGAGMLGGSGRSPLRLPKARIGKQPRFGYGRGSVLSFLAGRRFGGRWLPRKRVGSRSSAWLTGKRTGGTG